MSIRPKYGKRSVLQVLSDGMSQRPPTGKSCCEDAALNAAEVDRLASERDTLQRCVDAWAARAEKVEAERDEWKSKYWGMRGERNVAAVKRLAAESARADLEAERYELQAKLDAAEAERSAEDERIEEQAKALHGELYPFGPSWENTGDYDQRCYITAIRAGWTKGDEISRPANTPGDSLKEDKA